MPDFDEDPYDEFDCDCGGDMGLICVCVDDMCRGSEIGQVCQRFDDPSCYRRCPKAATCGALM